MGGFANVAVEEQPEPSPLELTTLQRVQQGILAALQARGSHIYAGTVPWAEVQRRRRRNKMARLSRRANR